MDEEVDILVDIMDIKETIEKASLKFYKGTLEGKDIVLVRCGIGKVNAAMGAALALNYDEYNGVINTGWSGAVSGVFKGDIIVSDSCVECDFDLTPIGRLPGQKPGQDDYIYKCDNTLYNAACSVEGFKHGNLGTGDFFLTNKELGQKYKEIFNISAFDMESGALGAVCYLLNVPFVSVRKISDNADDVSVSEYTNSVVSHVTAFSDIVLKILEKL